MTTAANAGYRTYTTRIGRSESGTFVRQFVVTACGVVARTEVGPGVWEIALLRPRCKYGRFQGTVYATGTPGVYRVTDPDHREIATVTGDYLDAEAVAVTTRSETRSCCTTWPQDMVLEINPARKRAAERAARERLELARARAARRRLALAQV